MTLYQVCNEWEHNGYYDSDFYIVTYDDENDVLSRLEVGSTRFASCRGYDGVVRINSVTEDIWIKAEIALTRLLAAKIQCAEEARIKHPKELGVGERVVLNTKIKNRPRTNVKSKCEKCSGSGKWINPKKETDQRDCFGCTGLGEKTKSEAIKGKMVVFQEGTKATVKASFKNVSQYGTWNYGDTIICVTDDGKEFRTLINNVNRDEEIPSLEKCKDIAEQVAKRRDFYDLFRTSIIGMVK